MTPHGLEQLRNELRDLEEARSQAESDRSDEANRTRQLTILKGQIQALTQRISTAKVIEAAHQAPDQVRFGTTVTMKTRKGGQIGQERTFTIVGVDEASITEKKIAFVAPLAKAIMGGRLGEIVKVQLGKNEEEVEITSISYS